MEIRNTRRILVASAPSTPISSVLSSLLSSPIPDSSAVAGRDLHHNIKTAYYEAQIPVWIDAVETPSDWSFMWKEMEGAKEVVEAVGAWIAVFEKPTSKSDLDSTASLLASISSMIKHHTKYSSYETVRLAVALLPVTGAPSGISPEQLEDICSADDPSESWELIDAAAPSGTNEYGEKQGLERLVEALETAEWDTSAGAELEPGMGGDSLERQQPSPVPSPREQLESTESAERMLEGLPLDGQEVPILASAARESGTEKEGDEDDVDALQRMLVRMQAARDMGADLPETERKSIAAKAVREVMDEL